MAIPIDQAVTSFESLMSTVEKDHQVYCWFAHLIWQAPLRERLSGEEGIRRSYRALDRIAFAQRLLYMFFWIFLVKSSV